MPDAPAKPGDRITLHLDSLAAGGEAVGRHEGMAVFVMWGCPGDEAEVEITEVSRAFARGVVRSVITPSPDRIEAPCPHFADCGGCQLQQVSYPAQLRHKTAILRGALARIGKLPDVQVEETWGMDEPWLYRGRAEYHAEVTPSGDLVLGFTRYHSHDVVPLTECRLQHPLSERTRAAVVDLMSRVAQTPSERAALLGLETLVSFADGRALATLICDGRPPFVQPLAHALIEQVTELAGVLAARRRGHSAHRSPAEVVVGESHIIEEIAGGGYRVSADSFFQSSPAQAARAVELVRQWADVHRDDIVLDLYSGVGTFLFPLALDARRAFGVEESRAAVLDARANARHWRLPKVVLYERRAERFLAKWVSQDRKADVVVLDPPRRGCGAIVIAQVAKLRPRRIVLVSCHPAALARDLATLAPHGYHARRVQPIDMFPQTWHVEAVALCEAGEQRPA